MGGPPSVSKLQVKNDVSCFIVAGNPHLRGPRRSSSTLRAKNEKGAATRAKNGETPAAERKDDLASVAVSTDLSVAAVARLI